MSPRRFRSLQDPDALRSLVANLREAIYITDMRGNVLDANPAFFQLLGVRLEIRHDDHTDHTERHAITLASPR